MRLIDADELEREMCRKCIDTDEEVDKGRAKWNSGLWVRYKVFEDTITLAPRVDAEPIRHGKWKIKAIRRFEFLYETTGYEPLYQCSECGRVMESYLRLDKPIMPEDADFPRYCPNCGARMDEEEL